MSNIKVEDEQLMHAGFYDEYMRPPSSDRKFRFNFSPSRESLSPSPLMTSLSTKLASNRQLSSSHHQRLKHGGDKCHQIDSESKFEMSDICHSSDVEGALRVKHFDHHA